jgi:hypothetical protein
MDALPKSGSQTEEATMADGRASTLALASWPTPLRCPLLLLVVFSLGCVNLEKPWVLTHPDSSVAPAGGSDASAVISGTGGAGPGPDSSGGTSGASGTGGSGSGGIPADSGTGSGGNTGTDASLPLDYPQATGGIGADVGVGGSGAGGTAGRSGGAGGTGTELDGGAGGVGAGGSAGRSGGTGGSRRDAGSGGTAAGGTSGVGGTTGGGGATGQGGVTGAGGTVVPDAVPVLDTGSPDKPCALCAIGATLVHRYSFNGSATEVTDSVGTADGTATNVQLSGSGTLVLAGGTSNQYVDLPDHILSTLTSATLEIWVTWNGGNNNQRILDFGSNEQVSGKYQATTTVIISPNSAPDGTPRLRASYSNQVSSGSTFVDSPNTSTLPTGSMQQIVAVFDGPGKTIALYLNGALEGEKTGLEALSLINDTNNWLGKSQYTDDPGFAGTYHEFRIYNAPLTAEQVQAVYAAGTNASFDR